MGLPGAGKTYLANILHPMLDAIWINADKVRKEANDWDFSEEGRKRQSERMRILAEDGIKKKKKRDCRFYLSDARNKEKFQSRLCNMDGYNFSRKV